MVQIVSLTLAAAGIFAGVVSAHPHAPASPEELSRRTISRRSLAACQDTLSRRGGLYDRSRQRREAFAHSLRQKRALKTDVPFRRDLDTVLATDHESDLTGVTNNTDASTLFAGNSSCVLQPETTEGPYYVDGEYVRWDLREDQEGVDTYVDVQLIDTNTCEPVPDVYIDFWHANSTGVYAGIIANGNGDSSDATNIDKTFLRGLQPTDTDGVAQFLTVFPGHYTGRATHVHIVAHHNGTVASNGTFTSTLVSHIGQIFFDQSLISAVEVNSPYTDNAQTLTTNAEDMIMSGEAEDTDPVVEYVYLGDSVTDGIMGWVAIGIDTSAEYSISAAATLTEDGGVANENSGIGAPPGSNSSSSAASGSSTASAEAAVTSDNAANALSVGLYPSFMLTILGLFL